MEKIKNENSKAKILNSATKLFAQKGFDGVSIREICKDAGVNICMISYYFGGKQDLYQGILDDLVEKQTVYAKTFINFEQNPENLTKKEKIDLLMTILDKFIDFFYSRISKDLIILLLKEQQKPNFFANSPAFNYLRSLIASLFDKDVNDREIILKTLFILAQINSPRILVGLSLRLLGQDDFVQEDIKIIKENVKFYVNALIKESQID
ncbi:MAG: TetR/AcrR family transcriptional regulator [Clostridium sp.]|nr:TetR/AcrR family transcriptional regulator [Clostridium sp.]